MPPSFIPHFQKKVLRLVNGRGAFFLLLRKLLSPVSRRRFGGLRGLHKGGQAKPRKISDMRALLCRVKSL